METIVVGVDGSEASVRALRWAIEEARLRGAAVRAVHAWSYPRVSTYHEAARAIEAPFAEEAEAVLGRVVQEAAEGESDVEVQQVTVEGPAAAALVEASSDASLLVVGSRGLGGFSGLLLGSVSHQVASHASCAVVIVR
jgi:nucleotide-binding universal stress UspA family protein